LRSQFRIPKLVGVQKKSDLNPGERENNPTIYRKTIQDISSELAQSPFNWPGSGESDI
jgi:hypothetical protein